MNNNKKHPVAGQRNVPWAWGTPSKDFWARMDDIFQGMGMERSEGLTLEFTPKIDIREKEGAYVVTAEVPGVEREDVSVELRGNNLIIKGEKHEEKGEKHDDYRWREACYGAFTRTMTLPTDIDNERVMAQMKNGVLRVEIAKSEHARGQQRKIDVK